VTFKALRARADFEAILATSCPLWTLTESLRIVRILGDTMRFPLVAGAATRVCVAATLSALSCLPAAAQGIDYSKLEIRTTDLGHGVYLLGWQGGDSLLRARVQRLIDEGKSEDEAVAAKPTKDFDAKWVHQGNFVTGDTLTGLAYRSLEGVAPPTTPRP
jgi:hypothetical protein